jgi:hypothetical protein
MSLHKFIAATSPLPARGRGIAYENGRLPQLLLTLPLQGRERLFAVANVVICDSPAVGEARGRAAFAEAVGMNPGKFIACSFSSPSVAVNLARVS